MRPGNHPKVAKSAGPTWTCCFSEERARAERARAELAHRGLSGCNACLFRGAEHCLQPRTSVLCFCSGLQETRPPCAQEPFGTGQGRGNGGVGGGAQSVQMWVILKLENNPKDLRWGGEGSALQDRSWLKCRHAIVPSPCCFFSSVLVGALWSTS